MFATKNSTLFLLSEVIKLHSHDDSLYVKVILGKTVQRVLDMGLEQSAWELRHKKPREDLSEEVQKQRKLKTGK